MTLRTMLIVALASTGLGCGGEQVGAGSEVVDDVAPVGRHVFHAPVVDQAAIVVELVELGAGRLVIDVVARGLAPDDRVMAAGVRLRYDPSVLGFVSAAPGERWMGGVTMVSGATPGVVVAGVAHGRAFYEEPLAPAGDHVLYRVEFEVTAVGPTPLELVAARSRAFVWPGGEAAVTVAFVGAELTVEP